MAAEIRTTDKKGRLCLPRAFANATVIVEQISDTEVRIRKAQVIPEDEVRLFWRNSPLPRCRTRTATPSWRCWTTPRRRTRRFGGRRPRTRNVMDDWRIERLDQSHDRKRF